MLVAPLRFKSVLLDEMDRVINAARLGRPASMILKNNSISDRDIILKLEEASCAGVRIDMIVRGICCVRAGVPGKTGEPPHPQPRGPLPRAWPNLQLL